MTLGRAGWLRGGGAAALVGLLAALAALATAELAAAFLRPQASPVVAIGGAVIDATPRWLKEWAIRQFGTSDKLVLIGGILVVLVPIAVGAGAVARRHRVIGIAGVVMLGCVGAAAAVTRPAAQLLDAVPSLMGAAVGSMALTALVRALSPEASAPARSGKNQAPKQDVEVSRRRVLVTAGGIGAASLAGGVIGRRITATRNNVIASRAAVRLPTPTSAAVPLPGGVDLRLPGLTPFTTPTGDFYRIDTAIVVPQVSTDAWRLKIHGMVDREIEIDFAQLIARGMVERDVTLTCVSNEVGGGYAGNARWLGVPLVDLLKEVGVHPGADMVLSKSKDGMTIGTPTAALMDGRDALLAVGMNGVPLPPEHGFPVRMVVPGLYGYVSATKWVVDLELTTFADSTAYWTERGWAEQGPILTASRIDTPQSGARPGTGKIPVAGVAWAQHRGISKVEVRVDGGPWQQARLAEVPSVDTWVQWVWQWDATPGSHTLEVRATDTSGATQTERRADPFPAGATGWHSRTVNVSA